MSSRTKARTARGWDIGLAAAILAVVLLGWLTAPGSGGAAPARPARSCHINERNTEMNSHTLSRRNRPGRSGPRRPAALAALAATGVLLAACGGNSPSGGTGSTQYQKALAFTKCMRSHGALGFPDPTSAGTITVTQALLSSPQIQAAAPSCKKLLPRGAVQLPAGLQRKLDTQALEYAACMRSHGVPNFPDPIIHNGSIGFRIAAKAGAPAAQPSPGASPAPKSQGGGAPALPPQYQTANRACQKLMPGNG